MIQQLFGTITVSYQGGKIMDEKNHTLTAEQINRYRAFLHEQERAEATIQKYLRDLHALEEYLGGKQLTKLTLIGWKEQLNQTHAPSSVNSMLAAINGFLTFMNWQELKVRLLKIQKPVFCDQNRELTRDEYIRLVNAAKQEGNERLSLVIQTICATGIRVSELRFITAEAVYLGHAKIINKGKHRMVFLPQKLCQILKKYLKKQKRTAGAVFTTRTGRPLDRSNIWREMKSLCQSAGVEPGKVFPHNLRHLFARTYYTLEHDLSRLADILGHSSINTTRIYTMESGLVHSRQMSRMGLIIT